MKRPAPLFVCLVALIAPASVFAEPPSKDKQLAEELAPFIQCIAGQRESFTLTAEVKFAGGGKTHDISARLAKFDAQSFDLDLEHQDYRLQLYRRSDRTVMILPLHKTAFLGAGPLAVADHLGPDGIGSRIVGPGTIAAAYLPMLWAGNPEVASATLRTLLPIERDRAGHYSVADEASIVFSPDSPSFDLRAGAFRLQLQLDAAAEPADLDAELAAAKVTRVDRDEIERTITRGIRRAAEVLAPSPLLTLPIQRTQTVDNGQLRWIDGQRVAVLSGTPEQIGRAHGKLLKKETLRCIDSVIHMFGLAQTIENGRWFKHDLDAAYQRLESFIPADHQRETKALADAIGWDRQLVQAVNVFPELFHCSGFAVFGTATKDGKLYHGRVLDYMTTIGLQDSATTFIVAVDGKYPFANVGYAGFIGSVSGMNDRGISLGEMGGRGEGQWDGVPMATLMRRAMEECSTLAEVKALWAGNPRTCQYYYVFADGKTNEAVGVAATPSSLQFINPGDSHPLLGDGIQDAVVLSADERLRTLQSRVQDRHGEIDVEIAKWLMSRPVAMQSNLHNVLFVPQDGVMFVANADHQQPAAERPYVKIDLGKLLESIGRTVPGLAAAGAE